MSADTYDFDTVPNQIGRYMVDKQIGRGGMGLVYLAQDPLVKRPVAIKLLSRQRINDDATRQRFHREAEIVANLEHAGIVSVYDFGEHDELPYIVMQFMGGGSLQDRLSSGPVTLDTLATVFEQIAPGLDTAHEKGIVHRDIKPANILFDQLGVAYIADFGIAKIKAEFVEQLTGNVVVGTPEYMSPEQVRGNKEVDGRSDIYALGVVTFFALSHRFPFQASNAIGTAVAHIMDPIPSILKYQPDLPKETDWLLEKALAKDPKQRFQTAAQLAEWLRLLADGRGYLLRLADL